MNRSGAIRTLTLAAVCCLCVAIAAAGGAPAQYPASPEYAAAVAVGRLPVAAWHTRTPAGGRVVAAAPAEAPAMLLGPAGVGEDGAPAATAYGDGRVLLAAARHTSTGSGVWSRVWDGRDWSPVVQLPRADLEGHHPALAGDSDGAWAVWVSGNASRGLRDRIVAAYWNGSHWGPAEEVPAAPGAPMAPFVVLDRRGAPIVIWSASDGSDAEIWAARRIAGSWRTPERVTDNDTPDIEPRAAIAGDRITAAWSTLTADGYVPHTARARARGWSPARRLSAEPGNAPVVIGGDRPTVVWTAAASRSGDAQVVGKQLVAGLWRALPSLGVARNARLAAAGSAGRVTIAWHERGGLRVGETRTGGSSRWRLTDLRHAPTSISDALEVELPGTYLGFGDSITEGLVRYDEEISFVEPYTTFLANRIAQFVQVPEVSIRNAGVSGELTSEGTNRLAAELLAGPTFVLIMEGANDAANLIDAEVTAANLEFMVQRALDYGVLPFLATITPRTEFNFTGANNQRILDVNDRIRQFAPLYRVQIVDQYSAFFRRTELYSDILHPNEEGYAYMGDVWFEGLRPILKAWLLELDDTDSAQRDFDIDRSGRRERRPRG